MEQINVATLLKDCPTGMELDCLMYDNLYFDSLNADYYGTINCYTLNDGVRTHIKFTKYGTFNNHPGAKCVIFPKGKTTWKGFVPPCQFKIEKGKWYVCIRDLDDNYGTKAFCKGSTYYSTKDETLQPDNSNIPSEIKYCVNDYFRPWNIQDAKDDDVLFHSDSASNGIFIFKEILQLGTMQKVICYCDYDSEDGFCLGENHTCCWTDSKILHPATKEQRNILFQKMKEAGYERNAEAKTLETLIEPLFKVGDKVRNKKNHNVIFHITSIEDDSYICGVATAFWFEDQDNYELVPNKFDIHTLTPLQPVLVRNTNGQVWTMDLFSHIIDTNKGLQPSIVCVGHCPSQCIPYKGNEFLRGTADECKDFYKTWES